jgi:hypothetical protein
MSAAMKSKRPDLGLERVLVAFERELADATDEEVLAAARDIGIDPTMQGSAAFFGVMLSVKARQPTDAQRMGKRKATPLARRRIKRPVPPSN